MSTTSVYPLEAPVPQVACVPRQFGVGVLMVLVTGFSVLFALLRSIGMDPPGFILVSVLFLGAIVGQVVLFGGKRPRTASALTGAILFPITIIAIRAYSVYYGRAQGTVLDLDICLGVFCATSAGVVFGYAAGGTVAGIFLVWQLVSGHRPEPPPQIDLQPMTAADIDTLLAWLQPSALLTVWAGHELSCPVERSQLEDRLEAGTRLCFKAVCRDTGQMVGYVELGRIDRSEGSAAVELPIIDPAAPGRGALSVALLRAAREAAFQWLGLQRLDARISRLNPDSLTCLRMAGYAIDECVFEPDREYRSSPDGPPSYWDV